MGRVGCVILNQMLGQDERTGTVNWDIQLHTEFFTLKYFLKLESKFSPRDCRLFPRCTWSSFAEMRLFPINFCPRKWAYMGHAMSWVHCIVHGNGSLTVPLVFHLMGMVGLVTQISLVTQVYLVGHEVSHGISNFQSSL